jgi:ubiquitin carboxyl-terminal hydrolase 7
MRRVSTYCLTADADDTIYEHKFAPEDVIGLEHIDRSGRARMAGEKAIVIRG